MLFDSSIDIFAMIGLIYDAALDAARWPSFLSRMAEEFGGHQATLYSIDSATRSGNIHAEFGVEISFRNAYNDFYAKKNPFSPIVSKLDPCVSATIDDLIHRGEYFKSEFFSDWVAPQRCAEFITSSLNRSFGTVTGVTILRGRRPFDDCERARFDLLLPHLRRALDIHGQLSSANLRSNGFRGALDRFEIGVAVVTSEAKVVFANLKAERIFSGRYGLMVRGGRIVADSPDVQVTLLRAIQHAVDIEVKVAPDGIVGLKGQLNTCIPLLVCPISRESTEFGNGSPLALLIFGGSGGRVTRQNELQKLLGLTPAEARLLAALVAGKTLAEHAEVNGLSHETVKTQMRKVLIKTGESRQSDVIRRVLNDPVLARP